MLLLAISIGLFSIVFMSVYSLPAPVSTPSSNIVGLLDEDNNQIIFHHLGGEPISGDGILRIYKGKNIENKKLSDYIGDEWEIGESIIYPIYNINNTFVSAMIIDINSNSIVSNAVLKEGYSSVNPYVATLEAVNINKYQATLIMAYDFVTTSGNLFFSYRESGSSDPWINTSFSIEKTGYGNYADSITGLTLDTTYEYKAIMKNGTGYLIGSTKSFTTAAISLDTFVNALPAIINISNYNISATGETDLDNVSLYYRHSSDGGITWETSGGEENWWNSAWQKRKPCTIQGSTAGAVANYPIPITIHYGSGTDDSRNVYLNSSAQSDFDDIRFVTSSGTMLPYYLEQKINDDKALFWVSIDLIPAHPLNTTCFVYYGNTTVTTTSDGDATFSSFEGFETTPFSLDTAGSNSIDLAKKTTNAKQGNSCAQHNDSSQNYRIEMQNDQEFKPTEYEFGGWVRIDSGWSGNDGLGPGIAFYCDPGTNNGYQIILDARGSVSPQIRVDTKHSGGNRKDGDFQVANNQWYYISGWRNGNSIQASLFTEDQFYTGIPQTTNEMTQSKYTDTGYHGFFVYGTDYQFWDALRVRKRIEPEPTIISWDETGGNGWVKYETDEQAPWYWDFYFGEHPGLYEFFSVGQYNNNLESWPETADESCIYNTD